MLFEGLASGCRLVATELPGFREIFGAAKEETVRLIPLPPLETIDRPYQKDEARLIDALSESLLEMIAIAGRFPDVDDPQADKIPAGYTWPRVFDRTLSVYEAAVHNENGRNSVWLWILEFIEGFLFCLSPGTPGSQTRRCGTKPCLRA